MERPEQNILQESKEVKAQFSGVVFVRIINWFWFTLNVLSMFYTKHTIIFLHILATDIHTIITYLQLIITNFYFFIVNHFIGLSLYLKKKTVWLNNTDKLWRVIINVHRSSCDVTLLLSHTNQNQIASTSFSKEGKYKISQKPIHCE
jgi:hypothetical protein